MAALGSSYSLPLRYVMGCFLSSFQIGGCVSLSSLSSYLLLGGSGSRISSFLSFTILPCWLVGSRCLSLSLGLSIVDLLLSPLLSPSLFTMYYPSSFHTQAHTPSLLPLLSNKTTCTHTRKTSFSFSLPPSLPTLPRCKAIHKCGICIKECISYSTQNDVSVSCVLLPSFPPFLPFLPLPPPCPPFAHLFD